MPTFRHRIELEVFLRHPVDPGLIQGVGEHGVPQGADDAAQLHGFVGCGDREQPGFGVGDDLVADVLQAEGEELEVVESDLAGDGCLSNMGEFAHGGVGVDQTPGLAGVQAEVIARPRRDGRGTIELELRGPFQLGQVVGLRRIQRVLRGLDCDEGGAVVGRGDGVRGFAKCLHCVTRDHVSILLEQTFDDKDARREICWNHSRF